MGDTHVAARGGEDAGRDTGSLGGSTSWLDPTLALTRFAPQAITESGSRGRGERVARYGFSVAGHFFVMPAGTPSEVLSGMTVYPLPHTPAWLVGLVNLRGNLIPAYDMAVLLEREPGPISKRLLLVLERGERAIALLVDALPRPFRESTASPMSQTPELPARLRPHARQAFIQEEAVWFDLDHLGMVASLREEMAEAG